ncbi:MAG: LysM peptidoglycan-binding domain-containing protein [Desulfomonilia bacterium]|nr:LysM peptidoglycan-binding domain-containing protein [Deltaproteobacteria bacterium]
MKRTASLFIGTLALFLATAPLWADDIVHTVKKGDTLWDITRQYLQTPWQWPVVWANNQDITNPHLIYPNDKVVISKKDGKTTITIIPAGQPEPTPEPAVYTPEEIAQEEDKSIVISPRYSAYIYSPNILTGSGTVTKKLELGDLAARNENIFITSSSGLPLHRGVTIVSKVAEITDLGGKKAGYLYKTIAFAMVEDAIADTYKARVEYSNQEIRSGDIIFDDLQKLEPLMLKISEPPLEGSGRVIDIYGGISGSSYLDLIFIDLGKTSGVDQGALLTIYEEASPKKGAAILKEYQGIALVLQSLDNSCMALIMDSKGPIQKNYIAVGTE